MPTFPRQRLSDLLSDANFLEVQIQTLQTQAGPHWLKGVGQRIARLHARLDDLEYQLRARASLKGSGVSGMSRRQLRRRLSLVTDRRQSGLDIAYDGPERRKMFRRASDRWAKGGLAGKTSRAPATA
jgi:hypothetical protein